MSASAIASRRRGRGRLSLTETAGNTTLKVTDGVHTANITLLGQYSASSFAMASDNDGGTLIEDPQHNS
jgi:hypothetical protein